MTLPTLLTGDYDAIRALRGQQDAARTEDAEYVRFALTAHNRATDREHRIALGVWGILLALAAGILLGGWWLW